MFLILTFVLQFFDENRNKNLNNKKRYLKHLTAFLAILCRFDIFWGILQPF